MNAKREIKKIVKIIATKYRPQKIILYGSYASGKATKDSDLDLLIIKKTKKRFLERISDVFFLCDTELPLEPLVYTPSEIRIRLKLGDFFIKDVLKKGKLLYEEK